jgi:ubiquinone/menaquinone biosynthesis C-methylase UbiE
MEKTEEGYRCKCGFFAKDKGYIDFINTSTPYWGEISEEEMNRTLRVFEKSDEESLLNFLEKNHPERIPYLYNKSRISFVYHLPKRRFENVLDLGSGWGSLSFMLSKFSENVYSVENVEERIKFQKIMVEKRKIKNIKLIRADVNKLPFKEKSFDLIVVNGLLEWVGYNAKDHKEALKMQINFLKNLSDLITDDGFIYIGIENRFGMQYFLGTKDHIGLRFTSLMPRAVASFFSKILKKRSYTTLTYSYKGYKELLKKANLNAKFYWALPTYNFPKFSGDFEEEVWLSFFDYIKKNKEEAKVWLNSASIKDSKINKKLILLSKLPKFLQKATLAFAPSFQIIAYKKLKPKEKKGFLVASEENFEAKFFDLNGKKEEIKL